jgi:GT2 family glycosyltransferase
VATPDALVKVADALKAEPDTAVGTIVRYYDRPDVIQAVAGGWLSLSTGRNTMALSYPPEAPLNYIYGASFAISRKLRETVGYFDEKIFMYYEEMDYCIRISRAGFGFGAVDATVFHRHGGSQGGVAASAWQNVLVNKWYVLRKHLGLGLWSVVYWFTLLARCVDPRGTKNGTIGARRAFKALLAGAAAP